MPVTTGSLRSATAQARRAEIIAATTAIIADEGLGQASFARIAQRAGLSSTRLISYHFTDKQELIAALVAQVVEAIGEDVGRRVSTQRTAAGQLRVYIESVVDFTGAHRAEMRALLQVVLGGALPRGTGADDPVPGHLEAILRRGQVDGEFRDFDPRVMALTVQRAVEALPFALDADPELDCPAFGRELVTLFALATRLDRP